MEPHAYLLDLLDDPDGLEDEDGVRFDGGAPAPEVGELG
jgi:hypothetical protein